MTSPSTAAALVAYREAEYVLGMKRSSSLATLALSAVQALTAHRRHALPDKSTQLWISELFDCAVRATALSSLSSSSSSSSLVSRQQEVGQTITDACILYERMMGVNNARQFRISSDAAFSSPGISQMMAAFRDRNWQDALRHFQPLLQREQRLSSSFKQGSTNSSSTNSSSSNGSSDDARLVHRPPPWAPDHREMCCAAAVAILLKHREDVVAAAASSSSWMQTLDALRPFLTKKTEVALQHCQRLAENSTTPVSSAAIQKLAATSTAADVVGTTLSAAELALGVATWQQASQFLQLLSSHQQEQRLAALSPSESAKRDDLWMDVAIAAAKQSGNFAVGAAQLLREDAASSSSIFLAAHLVGVARERFPPCAQGESGEEKILQIPLSPPPPMIAREQLSKSTALQLDNIVSCIRSSSGNSGNTSSSAHALLSLRDGDAVESRRIRSSLSASLIQLATTCFLAEENDRRRVHVKEHVTGSEATSPPPSSSSSSLSSSFWEIGLRFVQCASLCGGEQQMQQRSNHNNNALRDGLVRALVRAAPAHIKSVVQQIVRAAPEDKREQQQSSSSSAAASDSGSTVSRVTDWVSALAAFSSAVSSSASASVSPASSISSPANKRKLLSDAIVLTSGAAKWRASVRAMQILSEMYDLTDKGGVGTAAMQLQRQQQSLIHPQTPIAASVAVLKTRTWFLALDVLNVARATAATTPSVKWSPYVGHNLVSASIAGEQWEHALRLAAIFPKPPPLLSTTLLSPQYYSTRTTTVATTTTTTTAAPVLKDSHVYAIARLAPPSQWRRCLQVALQYAAPSLAPGTSSRDIPRQLTRANIVAWIMLVARHDTANLPLHIARLRSRFPEFTVSMPMLRGRVALTGDWETALTLCERAAATTSTSRARVVSVSSSASSLSFAPSPPVADKLDFYIAAVQAMNRCPITEMPPLRVVCSTLFSAADAIIEQTTSPLSLSSSPFVYSSSDPCSAMQHVSLLLRVAQRCGGTLYADTASKVLELIQRAIDRQHQEGEEEGGYDDSNISGGGGGGGSSLSASRNSNGRQEKMAALLHFTSQLDICGSLAWCAKTLCLIATASKDSGLALHRELGCEQSGITELVMDFAATSMSAMFSSAANEGAGSHKPDSARRSGWHPLVRPTAAALFECAARGGLRVNALTIRLPEPAPITIIPNPQQQKKEQLTALMAARLLFGELHEEWLGACNISFREGQQFNNDDNDNKSSKSSRGRKNRRQSSSSSSAQEEDPWSTNGSKGSSTKNNNGNKSNRSSDNPRPLINLQWKRPVMLSRALKVVRGSDVGTGHRQRLIVFKPAGLSIDESIYELNKRRAAVMKNAAAAGSGGRSPRVLAEEKEDDDEAEKRVLSPLCAPFHVPRGASGLTMLHDCRAGAAMGVVRMAAVLTTIPTSSSSSSDSGGIDFYSESLINASSNSSGSSGDGFDDHGDILLDPLSPSSSAWGLSMSKSDLADRDYILSNFHPDAIEIGRQTKMTVVYMPLSPAAAKAAAASSKTAASTPAASATTPTPRTPRGDVLVKFEIQLGHAATQGEDSFVAGYRAIDIFLHKLRQQRLTPVVDTEMTSNMALFVRGFTLKFPRLAGVVGDEYKDNGDDDEENADSVYGDDPRRLCIDCSLSPSFIKFLRG